MCPCGRACRAATYIAWESVFLRCVSSRLRVGCPSLFLTLRFPLVIPLLPADVGGAGTEQHPESHGAEAPVAVRRVSNKSEGLPKTLAGAEEGAHMRMHACVCLHVFSSLSIARANRLILNIYVRTILYGHVCTWNGKGHHRRGAKIDGRLLRRPGSCVVGGFGVSSSSCLVFTQTD